MSALEERIFPLQRLRFDKSGYGIESASDSISLLLFYEWTISDIKRPILRMAIFVLFWAGLLLLGIPAAFIPTDRIA